MTHLSERPLPSGWTTVELGELCDVQSGPGHLTSPASRGASGIPLLRPMNIGYRGQIVPTDLTFIPQEAAAKIAPYRLSPGDIVCARTGDPGRSALITAAEEGWLFSGNLLRLRLHDPGRQRYLLHFLGSPLARKWFEASSSRSVGIPSVTVATLLRFPVNIPPPEEEAGISAVLEGLAEKIAVHEEIARVTTDLRNLLSPLLLTGAMPAGREERS
ncbi:restriction endonuclease subunit S [Kitasatospora sp. RG8]|uniref:restriction endonuclease subunit S n=1 Tax=Kitasatospora sp. RG8 TaxID=2820815 RepID=UPI001AE0ADD1|nr:restriction endonuclease subunit S [Kitasatospora sp. RG8]MBP0455561.1 restriction endonuclease subunit S [Kitasatospora sp. RG8]